MPHIVIEHSAVAQISDVISSVQKSLFDAAFSTGLFTKDAIKVRSIGYENYYLPEGQTFFIHVNNKILSGRTVEQKQMLSKAIAEALSAYALVNTTISIEVSDLHSESYIKLQN